MYILNMSIHEYVEWLFVGEIFVLKMLEIA